MRRVLAWLGLAALAGATALVGALWAVGGGSSEAGPEPVPSARAERVPPIQARASLTPGTALFGDTVTARVEVTLDRARVDAASVRAATDFAPWTTVGKPERTRRDGKTTTYLRERFVLRCLASACLPPQQALRLRFQPATVLYTATGARRSPGRKVEAQWPMLVVHSRLDPGVLEESRIGTESPWKADLLSLPPVTYRMEPGTVRVPLFAAGGLFAGLGLTLAYLGRPRRRAKPVEAPAEPPEPVLTPREHALAVLEAPVSADGAGDRRRALELLAAELDGAGDADLAQAARRLAWSEGAPAEEQTRRIAVRMRSALGAEEDGDRA